MSTFFLKITLGFMISVSLIFGAAPLASAAVETPAEVAALAAAEQENQLIIEMNRQADIVFSEFQKTYPQAPISLFKKTQREIVLRLKQMNVISDLLKVAGPAPAAAGVAAELLTTFVFAPLAVAAHKPIIATALVVAPAGSMAAAMVFMYQIAKVRMDLAKELQVRSLSQLDRIRKEVIGYDIKHRVAAQIVESLEGNLAFEVLKKHVASADSKSAVITIAELQAIVKTHEQGAKFLESIYSEKIKPGFYSVLLLRFIDGDVELTSKMTTLLLSREPMIRTNAAPSSLRRQLIAFANLKKQVEAEIEKLQAEKQGLKARVKSKELTKADVKDLKKALANELKRLQALRHQVMRDEYVTLIEVKEALSRNDLAVVEAVVGVKATYIKTLEAEARFVRPAIFQTTSGIRAIAGDLCFDLFATPSL